MLASEAEQRKNSVKEPLLRRFSDAEQPFSQYDLIDRPDQAGCSFRQWLFARSLEADGQNETQLTEGKLYPMVGLVDHRSSSS